MKKLLTIFAILATIVVIPSCQKELPDAVKNIDVTQGDQTPAPTPTPTPDNPSVEGSIPAEGDILMPGY